MQTMLLKITQDDHELRGLISESQSAVPLHAAAGVCLRAAGRLSQRCRAHARLQGRVGGCSVGQALQEACQ